VNRHRDIPSPYLARWPSRPIPEEAAKAIQAWIGAQPAPTTRTRALAAMLKAKGLWVEREPPELVHEESGHEPTRQRLSAQSLRRV
jgi:hypothetical protein